MSRHGAFAPPHEQRAATWAGELGMPRAGGVDGEAGPCALLHGVALLGVRPLAVPAWTGPLLTDACPSVTPAWSRLTSRLPPRIRARNPFLSPAPPLPLCAGQVHRSAPVAAVAAVILG